MKSQARGLPTVRDGAAPEEDPFAELAEIFETELKFDQRFSDAGTPRRAAPQSDAGLDLGVMEQEFAKAFENDMRVAAPAPRATATSPRKIGRVQPTHLTDEEIDGELESVLRNLSAPARPRDRIVVETQSFAPERAVEERLPHAPSLEVDEFEELIRSELAVIRPQIQVRPAASSRRVEAQPFDAGPDEHAYISDFDGHGDISPALVRSGVWKRRLMTGASAAVFLLVAGAGYAFWNSNSAGLAGSDEPLLIKADAEPYKVEPKDPGGRAYPNQNKAVYDRVASPGKNDDTPIQQALIKNAEEPMELPVDEETSYADNLPGVELGGAAEGQKDETRISDTTEMADAGADAVLQPRKVKTMTVGADGRLIDADASLSTGTVRPSPEAQPAAASPRPDVAQPEAAAAPMAAAEVVAPLETAALAPPKPVEPPQAAKVVPAARPTETVEKPQPQPQPVQVASAMPTGGYFVQVSSQPSETGAQQSMRSFAGRYGSVVGDRPVGIQPADIPGKGMFYRVRVAASSKDEAASICAQLKSAGASCFVTR